MELVDYIDIVRSALALCGIPESAWLTEEQTRFRTAADLGLKRARRFHFWPFWLRAQERQFRADYASGTAYTNNGTIIFFEQTRQYYLALKATTGNPPADSNDDTDLARWAEAETSYSADDYSATKAYVAGDQVFYPTTGFFYQCHTASTGNLPTVTANWGRLYVFDRYVAWEQTGETALGDVLGVYDKNPRIFRNATPISYSLSENGVQVFQNVATVWLEFRLRAPRLKGAPYSATTAYAVNDQVYYSSATLAGNFYNCVTATSAGDSPDSAASKWSLVEIPEIFHEYLATHIYAHWLVQNGQVEKAAAVAADATELLAEQANSLTSAQQQSPRLTVNTR